MHAAIRAHLTDSMTLAYLVVLTAGLRKLARLAVYRVWQRTI
jgi:hypothetical protein